MAPRTTPLLLSSPQHWIDVHGPNGRTEREGYTRDYRRYLEADGLDTVRPMWPFYAAGESPIFSPSRPGRVGQSHRPA